MCLAHLFQKVSRRAEKKVIFLFIELYVSFMWTDPHVEISFKY